MTGEAFSSASRLEDQRFDFGFDGIGEFHAVGGDELHAVVVIRIVRGGDDDAGAEFFAADEPGDAGSGDDAGGNGFGAGSGESAGDAFGNVRTGFAGVAADEDARLGTGAGVRAQVGAERVADAIECGVIERVDAGEAANAVSAEELFGHGYSVGVLRY